MAGLRTWASLLSNNLNDGSNYSPSGTLLSSDDLLFTSTSVIDASATANFEVNSITTDASYTGSLSFKNYTGKLDGTYNGYALYFSGAGKGDFGNGLTVQSSSSTTYLGSGSNSFNAASCDMTFNGNSQQFENHRSATFNSIYVANSADMTMTGDGTTTLSHASGSTPFITLGTNGSFTSNISLILNYGPIATSFSAFNFGSGYVFNGTGLVKIQGGTADTNINITTNYTGTGDWTNFISSGYATLYAPASFGGGFNSQSSSLRSNSTLTFTGNSKKFILAANDCTSCTLVWNGTDGTFTGSGVDSILNSLILGGSASLSLTGSVISYFKSSSVPLTMGNNSTIKIGHDTYFGLITSGALHSIGTDCSITVSSGRCLFSALASSITATFPAFNFPSTPITVTGGIQTSAPVISGYTVNWTGDTTCSALSVYAQSNSSKNSIFDLNDYNLSLSGAFTPGNDDGANVNNDSTVNYGNGYIYIGSYDANTYTSGAVKLNYENSQIYCLGNFIHPSYSATKVTINPQSSYLQIYGPSSRTIYVDPGNSNITTKSFNDVEIKLTSGTAAFSGGPFRARNFTITSGNWNHNNYSMILSGNLTFNSSGSYGYGDAITFDGNSVTAYFDSVMDSQTSYPIITWNGTDGTWTDNKGVLAGPLIVSTNASLETRGTAKTRFRNTNYYPTTTDLKLDASSHLTINSYVEFYLSLGSSTAYHILLNSPYTLDGTGRVDVYVEPGAGAIYNISAITYSGSGIWTVFSPSTLNFLGALSFGGSLTMTGYSTGNINFPLTLTFTGNDSTFLWGTGVNPTIDATSCSLIYQGQRCALTDNNSTAKTFKRLNLKSDATVTSNGTYATTFQDTSSPLVLETGSHFTADASTKFYLTGSDCPYSISSGATFDGTSPVYFGLNNNNITGHLTDLNYTGSGAVNFMDGTTIRTGIVWNQENDLKMNTGSCGIYLTNAGSSATFICNNYDMTCGSLKSGIDSSSNFTINWGLGTRSLSSYDGTTHNSATGTCIQIFNRSLFKCSGNWSYGSKHTITLIPGNYTLTLIGNSTLISNTKKFNFVEINAPDSTVTLGDNFQCHGYKNIIGTLNANGKKFEITGDFQTSSNF